MGQDFVPRQPLAPEALADDVGEAVLFLGGDLVQCITYNHIILLYNHPFLYLCDCRHHHDDREEVGGLFHFDVVSCSDLVPNCD